MDYSWSHMSSKDCSLCSFWVVLLWLLVVSSHVCADQHLTEDLSRTLWRFLELSLSEAFSSRSLPCKIAALATQLHLLNSGRLPNSMVCKPSRQLPGAIAGLTSSVSHLSRVTLLCCPMSNVFTTIVSYISSNGPWYSVLVRPRSQIS